MFKKLLILFLLVSIPVYAGEIITEYSEETLPVLNEELRKLKDDVSEALDTYLSDEEVQDKVGAMFSGNTETRITATYRDADGTIDLVVDDLSSYYGLSNVVFCWFGNDALLNEHDGIVASSDLTDVLTDGTYQYFRVTSINTYNTILRGKFKKIAGVSSVNIYARIWSWNAGSDNEAYLKVDIGGQNNTVKSTTSTSPSWVTTSSIDVSSLTNGTVYDITIQLKSENSGSGGVAYCSAVMLIAS